MQDVSTDNKTVTDMEVRVIIRPSRISRLQLVIMIMIRWRRESVMAQ